MAPFPSTIWQDLDRARNGESAAWRSVVTRYRPAICGFLRYRGLAEADAEDVAQDVFFQIVRSRLLEGAHPRKGRFRSLVLAVTTHVMRHRARDERAEKRGGGKQVVSLDGIDPPAPGTEEEEAFDREWVRRLVSSALEELAGAHPAYHEALRMSLEGSGQEAIAAELGRSVAQVNNHAHRARMWMRRRLRSLIQESCADPEAYREELDYLGRYVDLGRD